MPARRLPLSSLVDKRIYTIEDDDTGHFVFKDSMGTALFMVSKDDLFAGDGNYFEDDLVEI